jgi:type IV secretion system protein VirB10
MKPEASPPDAAVAGERDTLVSDKPSVQSRVSNVLAISLMSMLGLGMLTWYYANALTRSSRARESAQSVSTKKASGDMPLPSIGRIDPPPPMADDRSPIATGALGGRSVALAATPLTEIPLEQSPVTNSMTPGAAIKSETQLALERQLSGAVFAQQSARPSIPETAASVGPAPAAPPGEHEPGELPALLRTTTATAVRAQLLPTQRLLLPKGAFIDCTLETAIDSTLPGMTTCVMATDTFGADGKVVLLERGTKLVGETRGQVQQGSARVFVLWDEARTPTGVVVPLASPGADELGRSGLPGIVDHHFWERFGAAMLVSVIDGAVQAAAQSSRGNSGTVVVNPSSTSDVLTEVLKNTINIAPTVRKQQGDRIQVLVARDLDFRSVYDLRSAAKF